MLSKHRGSASRSLPRRAINGYKMGEKTLAVRIAGAQRAPGGFGGPPGGGFGGPQGGSPGGFGGPQGGMRPRDRPDLLPHYPAAFYLSTCSAAICCCRAVVSAESQQLQVWIK